MEYISVSQFAEKYGISERTARNYCATGKIEGTFLTGKTWNIPADAELPRRSKKKVLPLLVRAFQIFWYQFLYHRTLEKTDTKTYDQLNFSRRLQINNNETLLQKVLTVSPTSPRIDIICINVNTASSSDSLSLTSLVYRTFDPSYSALKRSQTLLMNPSN